MKSPNPRPGTYSQLNPAGLFMMQRRQRVLARMLAEDAEDMSGYSLLEIGCGHGQWLLEFQMLGFIERNLAGIELDGKRFENAREKLPVADIQNGDASKLPWPDASFDFVFQSTVFTSILDPGKKAAIASEMKRVCKPDGAIIWYDFKFDNPKNPSVKGIPAGEIRELFAPWTCKLFSVTLAPPLSRLIVPVSWMAAEFAESLLPFLRTHLMAEIRMNGGKP